ncbi:MAG: CNNM domain-containing protein [Pirellulaceae bacterium]
MIGYLILFAFGISLSAFFSGSETGLYRVPRIRLVLDALSGRLVSKVLLWLANHPTVFVATVLVGNNIANYLTSFAVVMAVSLAVSGNQSAAELMGTVLVTPIVFVFGELLPKYLFFNAPYRLLGYSGPFLVLVTILFLPITVLLVLLNNLLSIFTGPTPFQSRQSMARGELQQMLRHGHNIGLLKASQQRTAQNMWQVGERPAIAFAVPPDRLARITPRATLEEAITAARRQGHPLILVEDSKRRKTIGYIRYPDLSAGQKTLQDCIRPIVKTSEKANNLEVLFALYDQDSDIAELVDTNGKVTAIVTRRQLQEPLMRN